MMFLDCPAYLDHYGAVRCGLPAEVERQYTMSSSDGPAESAKIRCPAGHWFNGAIESLTWESSAGVAFRAWPGRDIARPNGAPAYYQGRPVGLWLSAMRRRRGRAASRHGNRHRLQGTNAIRAQPPRRGGIETARVTSVMRATIALPPGARQRSRYARYDVAFSVVRMVTGVRSGLRHPAAAEPLR